MSGSEWSDFENVRSSVGQHLKVPQLQTIVSGLNERAGASISKNLKKADLIARIHNHLTGLRARNDTRQWSEARRVIRGPFPSVQSSSSNYTIPTQRQTPTFSVPTTSGTSSIGRYDPYAPPRRPSVVAQVSTPVPSARPPISTSIRFKPSPFVRADQAVSTVVECPESSGTSDRKSQSVTFQLRDEHIRKLTESGTKYQLRLYCTSSTFYTPNAGAFRPNISGPCPIEFPTTCEVRVNGQILQVSLKGLKKKPGTAPPPDVTKHIRMSSPASNRVELVYVNSQQPVVLKKYYMLVQLVEVTSVEELVDRLKKGKYKSGSEIMQKMAASVNEDDDIISGPSKISLKCPLSFMRIQLPSRSSACVHPSCFDATSWFSVMEQTTTYICPVCDRVLNPDDLIIDGYFDDILKQTSEDVEDVIVESDGQWHTSDNKYASAQWKQQHSYRSPTPVLPALKKSVLAPVENGNADEIVLLDSDDEDEVTRELSISNAPSSTSTRASQPLPRANSVQVDRTVAGVIDLTLDSEDEEPAAPAPTSAPALGKRKANGTESPTEQIWKKSRVGTPATTSSPVHPTSGSGLPTSRPSSIPPQASVPPSHAHLHANHISVRPDYSSHPPAQTSPLPAPSSSLPPNPMPPVHSGYGVTPPYHGNDPRSSVYQHSPLNGYPNYYGVMPSSGPYPPNGREGSLPPSHYSYQGQNGHHGGSW